MTSILFQSVSTVSNAEVEKRNQHFAAAQKFFSEARDAAERAWIEAKRKSPGLFDGGQKLIQRADLGSKGVFYRLRVGAFGNRPDAAEFCDALKSAQHQCIVVQN